MTAYHEITYKSFTIGSSVELSNQQMDQLIRLFETPSEMSGSVLGGRRSVLFDHLDDVGPVVVKQYFRGGLIRHVVKQRYLKCGKTRSKAEFEFLQTVQNLGVSAPEPVAFASKGSLFYSAWLVTREVPEHQTLASLSKENENRAKKLMPDVTQQVSILIQNRFLHVDLHPGNILATKDNTIYFIDFDKARLFKGNKEALKNRYISRWQRAVKKYGLPESLSTAFRDLL